MAIHNPVFVDESAYSQYIARPERAGWNSSTHLAKMDFGQGDEFAYIKLMFLADFPDLSNEAIGWQLAHACGIPAPSRAAIMVGSAGFWTDKLGRLPEGCPNEGDIAAWCVARCETLEQHSWLNMHNDQAALTLAKSPRGQQILAFYTWLHNADSNPRNLLRLGNGEWAVIDHEFLFNGLLGNWRKPPEQRDFSTPPYVLDRLKALTDKGRISKKANSDIRSAMVHYANDHQTVVSQALPHVARTLEQIELPIYAKSALPLIVDRAGNSWMPTMVNKLL